MVTDKPWGGRFDGQTDAFVEHFSASVDEDKRLARYDIRGSIAHARMLARTGILTDAEGEAIVAGLTAIGNTIAAGDFEWSPALEDVHMNIEAALVARIGDVGKKLHTARSRNDQVATAMRLYVRDAIDAVHTRLVQLVEALLVRAEAEAATVMPGFTHLQTAQPVTFGHHLLAWAEMAMRDIDRFHDARRRTNVSPLGAAALAGSSFAIDRADTAAALDFAVVAANSLDAVSDRDFAIDCVYACAMTMQHLSRWCEELVLWASPLVGMVILPDALCTGSSIMPQKKNPDVAELIRGKTGRVYGHLTALLTLMKAQPLAYNRDNQEDKRPVFDAIDTTLDSLHGITLLIAQLQPQRERMLALAGDGFSTATDLADYLVRCGVPFRDAHAQVGRIVRIAAERHVALHEVSLAEMRTVAPAVADDVFAVLSVEGSVAARAHSGGTAPLAVRQAVQRLRERLTTAAT